MDARESSAATICEACDLGWELEERDGVWWHESPTGNVGWICRTRSPEAVPVRSVARGCPVPSCGGLLGDGRCPSGFTVCPRKSDAATTAPRMGELVDAALALDDQWKELGSCETAGERVDSFVARFLDAVDAVRAERSRNG